MVKNGEASGYRDWFFINSYPVTHETRTYDCVGHYKWMPKLNLANPELRRYFIEVGKHWLRVSGAGGWTWPTSCPRCSGRSSPGS